MATGPGRLTGHAKYRADRPTESEIQLCDGPLRLKQLSRMSLAEHSLVALSCCQGGTATGQSLDEPVTLATGFSAAGAETVVANLWRVDDQVACIFLLNSTASCPGDNLPARASAPPSPALVSNTPGPEIGGGFFLLGNPG
ncbi:MAG: CHAT domain-containing protein [Vulcanimicrobiota bacterium]